MKNILLIAKDFFKTSRSFLRKVFSFNRKELLIITIGGGVIILLCILIPVILGTYRNSNLKDEELKEVQGISADSLNDMEPSLFDFIIDDQAVDDAFSGVIYSREPEQEWTKEEIDGYWIEPGKIVKEHLEKESDSIIEGIFSDVP